MQYWGAWNCERSGIREPSRHHPVKRSHQHRIRGIGSLSCKCGFGDGDLRRRRLLLGFGSSVLGLDLVQFMRRDRMP